MENNHPLCVPRLITNSVELYPKSLKKLLPDPAMRYVTALGRKINYLFKSLLPLTILFNQPIQVCARILVHPILVNAGEHVIGGCEEIFGEVDIA